MREERDFVDSTARAKHASLVVRARQGEEQAFRALFDAHKGRVYSLFLRITGSSEQAEDLTRKAFLKAFRSLSTLRDDRAFSILLYRLIREEICLRQVNIAQSVPSRCDSAREGNPMTRSVTRRGQETLLPVARLAR